MAVPVGEIEAVLKLRDEATGEFTRVFGVIKGQMGEVSTSVEKVSQSFKDSEAASNFFGNQMSKVWDGVVSAVKDAAMAIPNLIMHTANLGDELWTMSQQTGVSVEMLSALRFVSSQTGASLQLMTRAIMEMGKELVNESKDTVEALGNIGLSVDELKKMAPEQAFLTILNAMHELPTQAEKTAAGMAIFGGKWRMISQLAVEDVDQLIETAKELGLVWTTDAAKGADAFNDSLDVMSKMIESTQNDIANTFLPVLTKIAEEAPKAGGTVLLLGKSLTDTGLAALGIAANMATTASGWANVTEAAFKLSNSTIGVRVGLAAIEAQAVLMNGTLGVVTRGLGMLAAAGAAAFVGWQIGRLIAEVFGLDEKIASLTARILGLADAGKAGADARLNTLALASQRAGRSITDYTEAIRINQEWAEKQIHTNKKNAGTLDRELAEAYDKLKAKAQALTNSAIVPLTEKQRELVKLFDKGGMSISDITKELHKLPDGAKISEAAVKNLVEQQKKAAEVSQDQAKAMEAVRMATVPLTEAQQKAVQEHVRLGVAATDSAKALGLHIAQVQAYIDKLSRTKEITEAWLKTYKEIEDAGKKFLKDSNAAFVQSSRAQADASAKALADMVVATEEYHEKNVQAAMRGADLEIRQIERARDKAIAAAEDKFAGESAIRNAYVKELKIYYQRQIDMASATASTIVDRMRAAGVMTRQDLKETADDAKRDFDQMVASGAYSAAQIQAQWEKMVQANVAAMGVWGQSIYKWVTAIPALLQQALTGGGGFGGFAKALASMIGGDIGKQLFSPGGVFGNMVTKLAESNNVIAKAFGSMLPGIGQAIGALAGPLIGMVGNLFKKVFGSAGRDEVVKFADSFGGFDALHKKLLTLGAAGEALWVKLTQGVGRSSPEQAKKVIEEINKAFGAQDEWLSRLPGLIEKYGLSWEQAGQAVKQSKMDEVAQQLIQDFADLTKAGFDVNVITDAMAKSVSEYIATAKTMGVEVPAAMKPLLQKMIEMGTLTDAAGNKIENLDDIQFATTLTEGFKNIVDAIKELTRALTGDLGGALDELSRRRVVIPVEFERGTDGGRAGDIPSFANEGMVSRPTLAMIGDAPEPEFVLRKSTVAALAGANAGPEMLAPIVVQVGDEALVRAIVKVGKRKGWT